MYIDETAYHSKMTRVDIFLEISASHPRRIGSHERSFQLNYSMFTVLRQVIYFRNGHKIFLNRALVLDFKNAFVSLPVHPEVNAEFMLLQFYDLLDSRRMIPWLQGY